MFRTGSLKSRNGRTNPEKKTDASSSRSDSWTLCRSESETRPTTRPRASDASSRIARTPAIWRVLPTSGTPRPMTRRTSVTAPMRIPITPKPRTLPRTISDDLGRNLYRACAGVDGDLVPTAGDLCDQLVVDVLGESGGKHSGVGGVLRVGGVDLHLDHGLFARFELLLPVSRDDDDHVDLL